MQENEIQEFALSHITPRIIISFNSLQGYEQNALVTVETAVLYSNGDLSKKSTGSYFTIPGIPTIAGELRSSGYDMITVDYIVVDL